MINMNQKILVTGATGNVGKEVINSLHRYGHKVIAASRKPPASTELDSTLYRKLDFQDPATWEGALKGITKVFLMRPPHMANIKKDLLPFLRFLKTRELKQIVFLSVQGAEKNTLVPHNKVEGYLKKLNLPYTILRPSFFMQNLTTIHLEEIQKENQIFVPTGRGKTNFIDVRDIGEVTARVFTGDNHLFQEYTITGEHSYTYKEVARILSSELNRKISFVNPNPLSFVLYHIKKGRKPGMALVMLALYSVIKSGRGDISTSTTEELLERSPICLKDFIIHHKSILTGVIS